MPTKITFAILTTGLLLTFGVIIAILLARGYEFNPGTHTISSTGILVATSDPNGAEVFLNGKLKTATNTSLNLPEGSYDVKIQLDGFTPWEKKVTIKKEEVFKTNAFLFPIVPDLRPMTLSGALNPTLSPDQSKIVFGVASASAERSGVWLADMARGVIPNPLGGSADMRLIFRNSPALSLSGAKFLWSGDSKQILAYFGPPPTIASPAGQIAYLLNTDQLNDSLIPLTSFQISQNLTDWKTQTESRFQVQMTKLSPELNAFLATNAASIQFSPDETKVLYQATSSAQLSQIITTYIPGTDPTAQTRDTQPGNLYVYDIKEDRNYLISAIVQPTSTPTPAKNPIATQPVAPNISWFPSSRHLLQFTNKEIAVVEYDGTNKAIVYAGPFIDNIVFPFPNWSKIVILTSLNQAAGIGENLYTVNLR